MDAYTAQALVDLGSSLAVLAAKGTAWYRQDSFAN